MVPALYKRFIESARIANYDLSKTLNFKSGGSTLGADVTAAFKRKFKSVATVTQGYGEAAGRRC